MDYKKPHIYKRKIVNTGKYYIGKHKGGDKYYKGSGVEFKKDLKSNPDTLTEILEYVDDVKDLNKREIYWLEKFDAANNPNFYNKTNKSYGPINQTKKWREKQSNRMKGKSTTQDKKWKVKDTSNMKGGGFKGKKHTLESKTKIKNNITRGNNISKSLKGRDISKWNHKIYTKKRNEKIKNSLSHGILMLNIDGEIIKEFVSYNDVRSQGFPSVQRAIKNNILYKGYFWKNKKQYENNKNN